MSVSSNFPVHDITDLKEKISKLKAIQEEQRIIKSKYEEEITMKEEFLAKMRQEYIVLAPNAELRYHSSVITQAAGSITRNDRNLEDGEATGVSPRKMKNEDKVSVNFENSILDADFENGSRYRVWNDKLEMAALMEEMRIVLPGLEKDVKYYEKQVESYKKFLIKEEMKSLPSREPLTRGSTTGKKENDRLNDERKYVGFEDQVLMKDGRNIRNSRPERNEDFATGASLLLKSTRDLKGMIEKTIHDIIEDKLARKQNIEKLKTLNSNTLRSTTTLRKEIQSKLQERLSLKKFLLQFEKDHLLKKKRKDIIFRKTTRIASRENKCFVHVLRKRVIVKPEVRKRISFPFIVQASPRVLHISKARWGTLSANICPLHRRNRVKLAIMIIIK
jgi:hypothetical protein